MLSYNQNTKYTEQTRYAESCKNNESFFTEFLKSQKGPERFIVKPKRSQMPNPYHDIQQDIDHNLVEKKTFQGKIRLM